MTGAPVVPVAVLGTREPGGTTDSMPAAGSRLDLVFGEPVPVVPVPWPRRRDAVALLAEQLRARLARHVADACDLTGQSLPGPLPTEHDARPRDLDGMTQESA